MKILIYDCEIINCVPVGEINPNLNYCKGWRDFDGMGISVVGTWRNFDTFNPFGKYEAFIDYQTCDNLANYKDLFEFENLAKKADLIIGFNSLNFDDNLINKSGIFTSGKIKTDFDLLVEIRKADGQADRHYHYGITKKGFARKDLAACNLSYNKSGSGELAPVLWQQGKHQEVIDYCLRDVKILKELYFKFIKNQLKSPDKFTVNYKRHQNWVKMAYLNDF